MNDTELKDRARKRLERLCDLGTTINTIRIDDGRQAQQHYYAVLVSDGNTLVNISGSVARLIGRKWSNDNGNGWANSSGVRHRTASDLVEQLANELHGAYTAKEIGKIFHHVEL